MKLKTTYVRNGVKIAEKEKIVTAEELKRLEQDYKRTHPEGVDRISGCCDRAE